MLPDETESKLAPTSLSSDVSSATLADSRGFFPFLFLFLFLFFISNQRIVINEKKRKVQVVHDDEQQETEKPNIKTKDKEIRKII